MCRWSLRRPVVIVNPPESTYRQPHLVVQSEGDHFFKPSGFVPLQVAAITARNVCLTNQEVQLVEPVGGLPQGAAHRMKIESFESPQCEAQGAALHVGVPVCSPGRGPCFPQTSPQKLLHAIPIGAVYGTTVVAATSRLAAHSGHSWKTKGWSRQIAQTCRGPCSTSGPCTAVASGPFFAPRVCCGGVFHGA